MKIYNYNKDTKEFIKETDARQDPLDSSNYLIPGNATTIKPPVVEDGFVNVFSEISNSWIKTEDNRGIWYRIREEVKINDLGSIEEKLTKNPVEKTAEEIQAEQNQQSIIDAKTVLQNSDWIITKISEAQIKGEDITILKDKYSQEIADRETARNTINNLETN